MLGIVPSFALGWSSANGTLVPSHLPWAATVSPRSCFSRWMDTASVPALSRLAAASLCGSLPAFLALLASGPALGAALAGLLQTEGLCKCSPQRAAGCFSIERSCH